jgi:UDP-glucose 4-epimerase
MKIWITGIAGFLGSHLAETLIAEGNDVYGNDNLICGEKANAKGLFVTENCADFKRIRNSLRRFKPDALIHCAATAHEGLSSFSPSFITRNIYEASVATFSAAIAAGVKRIVYMSSMARYGAQSLPFIETMRPYPVDPYGIAKVAAEDTLKVLCNTHGVKWSIAIPHNIIGTRQRSVDPYRNVASIMINRCKQGKPPIIYGDGLQKRCFSPVKDCLPSLLKMVEGSADGEIINIGPDKGEISINDLAFKIIDLTGFNGVPLHMEGRPNEVRDAYCSSDKARRLLGYQEQQSLDDCLKEMVDYIQPAPFVYDFPLEIMSGKMPRTWAERLM